MKPIEWDIRPEGRRWSHEEFDERMYQAPEKIEFHAAVVTHDYWRSTFSFCEVSHEVLPSLKPEPMGRLWEHTH